MTSSSGSSQSLFLVIVGKNEPLYEAEFLKRGAVPSSDAVTRQNYFVFALGVGSGGECCVDNQSYVPESGR